MRTTGLVPQISWLIFKWMGIALVVLVALAVLIGVLVYGYNWYTHDRHAEKVQFIISSTSSA
jgi:uncharacterized membrane protein YukC